MSPIQFYIVAFLISWTLTGLLGHILFLKLFHIPLLVILIYFFFRPLMLLRSCLLGPFMLCMWDMKRYDEAGLEAGRQQIRSIVQPRAKKAPTATNKERD